MEKWANKPEGNDNSEIESDWSDGEGERGDGEDDDNLQIAEFLKLVEAQLASDIDWYYPNLLEDDDGDAVGKGKGKGGLEAYSQMYGEDLAYMEGKGDEDEQSTIGVV